MQPTEEPPPPPPFDVLVTGSSGHLGTALMLRLPTHGLTPLGIDILPSPTTHLTGSVSDPDFVTSVLSCNPSIRHIIHAATLHKPHVGTHTHRDFIDTNITGTSILLQAAATTAAEITRLPLSSFIFISTTSAFGTALTQPITTTNTTTTTSTPAAASAATWIDESVRGDPKNIYGLTKSAAEDLCLLAHRQHSLPVIVLRTSRFFPEDDDDHHRRAATPDPHNLKVLELAHRRVDISDIVDACRCAMDRAAHLGWGRYIISAPTPFVAHTDTDTDTDTDTGGMDRDTLLRVLGERPQEAFARFVPEVEPIFRDKGWGYTPRVDRVYDSSRAVRELGWTPQYTFERAVRSVRDGEEWRSPLTLEVGEKGYHATPTGVYTK